MNMKMKNKIRKILFGGAGLLEVLLAIGLVSSLAPFVFKTINKQSATMRNILVTKEIENIMYAFANYMEANMPLPGDPSNPTDTAPDRSEFTGKTKIAGVLSDFGLNDNISAVWNFFNRQQIVMFKKSESIEGFLILSLFEDENPQIDTLALQEIAGMIGPNAATVDYNVITGVTNEWNFTTEAITADQIQLGLVVQISRGAGRSDVYLNRVIEEKATMHTDLFMNTKKILNTGAVYAKTLKGAENKDYPFQVTEVTKISQLKIKDFSVKSPAQLTGSADGLKIFSYTLDVASYDRVGISSADNHQPSSALNEANRLELNTITANNSLLKSSDASLMGNVKIRDKLVSPARIQTNRFKLSNVSVFNNSIDVIAKEIRAKDIQWGAKINANTIVASNISYIDSSGVKGEIIDNKGVMHLSDFVIDGYSGYNPGSKQVSDIFSVIINDVDDLKISWTCIKNNNGNATGCRIKP